VVIVEFSDFQCPYCRRLALELDTLRAQHPLDVAVVYRYFPLDDLHPLARLFAFAATCADKVGRFEQLHNELYRRQTEFAKEEHDWTMVGMSQVARQAGIVDSAGFSKCLATSAKQQDNGVAIDTKDGQSLGVEGTPTILVDSIRIDGAPTLVALDSLVQRELADGARH
jgi:protein-disulfide isomerase